MAVWLVAAARGRFRVLATRRAGFSSLLRTSSSLGREARADFFPRAPGLRGGDKPLAGGGGRTAPAAKVSAASSWSMASAAAAPPQKALRTPPAGVASAAAASDTGLTGAASSGVALGSATPAAALCCCSSATLVAVAVNRPASLDAQLRLARHGLLLLVYSKQLRWAISSRLQLGGG
mmetsp:Transcript_82523/g.160933  ORF Transcript_82523/g.160933 Transcript_82523/m.160933 type:complete len:178 (+) Transcript_82523:276-809(+)